MRPWYAFVMVGLLVMFGLLLIPRSGADANHALASEELEMLRRMKLVEADVVRLKVENDSLRIALAGTKKQLQSDRIVVKTLQVTGKLELVTGDGAIGGTLSAIGLEFAKGTGKIIAQDVWGTRPPAIWTPERVK